MDHKNIYEYIPSEERQAAETFIVLMEGKSSEDWIKEIYALDPKDSDDRAMLEAISKEAKDLDVRKEANRRLYYTR